MSNIRRVSMSIERASKRRFCMAIVAFGLAGSSLLGIGPMTMAEGRTSLAPSQEATEQFKGTLRYKNPATGDKDPIAGADIAAADAVGNVVGNATTAEDGTWTMSVPGPGTYTVTLDVDSLPNGVGVSKDGAEELTKVLVSGQSAFLLFPLGPRARNATDSIGERAARLFAEGLNFGLIIAICAVGLSLIFGTTGLTNFGHGELVTFGALIAFFFNVTLGLHLLIAAPLAIICGGLFGGLLDLGLWRQLRKRGTSLVSAMIVSIGLALVLRNIFLFQFGGFNRKFAQYQVQPDGLGIGPVTISPKDLWSMGIAIAVLVGVALMLQLTRIGKAMRAVSDNRDLAEASGINVERVVLMVWCLGGALSALGGILLAVDEDLTFDMGYRLLLLMFAGVTLGGLGTAYGALIGSLVVGEFILLSTLVIKPELKTVGALVVLIVVLLVRPQGILGTKERVG